MNFDDLLPKSLTEHYDKLLSDKECLTRLLNRFASFHVWRDGIMIPQKLSSAFAQQCNIKPNTEAILLLQRLMVGLYNNARNYIDAVIDYGSWELARKSADDLTQWLLKVGRELLEKQNESNVSKP